MSQVQIIARGVCSHVHSSMSHRKQWQSGRDQASHKTSLGQGLPRTHFPRCRSQTTSMASDSSAGSASKPSIAERLSGSDRASFEDCLKVLATSLGVTPDDGTKILGKAFGWTGPAYWREKRDEDAPDPAQVQSVLAFLQTEVGLEPQEISDVVKKFPEVLGCSVGDCLQANLEVMSSKYFIKGDYVKSTVKRVPQVLGNIVDCGGDCVGECNRCWVRF